MNIFFNIALFVFAFLLGMCAMVIIQKHRKWVSPSDRLISLADGFLISRALYTIAELKIADELLDGSQFARAIAQKLNLDGSAVYRLLRMLAGHGVFVHNADDSFALNELSELLTTKHPQSLHGFLLHEDEARWQAYGKMNYTLETGKPAFNHLFNVGYFEYISRDTKRAEQFDHGMANLSEAENTAIAQSFNFKPFKTIVDIGGGYGGLLCAILTKYTDARGVLYEIPHVLDNAARYIQSHMMTDRITVTTGSFLESIPFNGDLYIFKRILHDWDDESCIKMLIHCRHAMEKKGRILIFDCIVPETKEYDISKDIDIIMMVIFGGKERTQKEFENLFLLAGLKLDKVSYIQGTMLAAIEVIHQ